MSRAVKDKSDRGYPATAYNPSSRLYPLLGLTDAEKAVWDSYVNAPGVVKTLFWQRLYRSKKKA